MKVLSFARENTIPITLLAITLFLAAFSILYFKPQVVGDSPSYVEAMGVMTGLPAPDNFVPNRILTTFGGLTFVLALAPFFGILPAWLLMNIVFYVVMAFASFFLFRIVFENERVALLGALFVVGNYAPLVFGLSYLMDAGGWAFYLLALWGVAQFLKTESTSAILWASAAVGVGALFKEYALLGCIAIAGALMWHAFREPLRAFRLMALTALIALVPIALIHLSVYQNFNYTYLDWTRFNAETYIYASRLVEFIKAFSSVANALLPLAGVGAGLWVHSIIRAGRGQVMTAKNVLIAAIALSALPVFFWGGITQRVLFMLVPVLALFSGFLFERFERWWYTLLVVFLLYLMVNVSMDSLLITVNLPL